MLVSHEETRSATDILQSAKNKAIDMYLRRGYAQFEKRWSRFEPLFTAYLQGYTLGEVCYKYNIRDTHVLKAMKEFGIQRLPNTQHAMTCARLAERNRTNRDKIKQELENCPCFTCRWVLARIKKIEHSQIETKGNWVKP